LGYSVFSQQAAELIPSVRNRTLGITTTIYMSSKNTSQKHIFQLNFSFLGPKCNFAILRFQRQYSKLVHTPFMKLTILFVAIILNICALLYLEYSKVVKIDIKNFF